MSAIWGSAFIAIKISVETFHPISVASFRLIIGAFFLYAYYRYKKYIFNLSQKDIILIILIGLIGNFIPFSLISWSEQYIKSNTAGLLLSVGPIFTLILSHFFTSDDKFSLLKFVSILIGLIGVFLILDISSIFISNSNNNLYLLPKVAIIISALGYVVSSILAYNLKKIDTMTITTFVTISAAIISIPFMIYVELNYIVEFKALTLLSIIYLGLFPTAIAFQLRFHIISKAGPIFLSYVAYLIPVFAIIWGYIFLGEVINITTFVGVIFILAGVFLSQKKSMKKNI